MEKEMQASMAQGRSAEIILIIMWIRTSRLSIKSLSQAAGDIGPGAGHRGEGVALISCKARKQMICVPLRELKGINGSSDD
jgi:hypothetical protein